jgi:serine/threonine protein kinase
MSDWQRIQSIFLAAADLPAEERDHAVGVLCEGDTELFDEVHSLLAADNDSSVTIDSAIQGVAATILDTPILIGERLGAYRIIREIGRGGMGSVFLALRDDEEYIKEVALKVVKRGMNSEEVLRRFRAERQILANLDHPYIASLFDGGTTADGVPFFAMEYVEGRRRQSPLPALPAHPRSRRLRSPQPRRPRRSKAGQHLRYP